VGVERGHGGVSSSGWRFGKERWHRPLAIALCAVNPTMLQSRVRRQ
jgi:hypothetical protein